MPGQADDGQPHQGPPSLSLPDPGGRKESIMNRIYQGKVNNVEIAIGSKLGIDATKKLPGEGFKRPWPPLIKMDESVRKKIDSLLG